VKTRPRVGFVTIGQSPRTDVMADIAPLLTDIEILEAGALDNVTDLAALAPTAGREENVLVSRLRDGSQIILGERKIVPLVQERVKAIIQQSVRLVVLLCTGDFPELRQFQQTVPVLFPDRLLYHFVRSVLPREAKLGVLVPLPEQIEWSAERWRTVAEDVRAVSLSPYTAFETGLHQAGQLSDRHLIVMDCMGYTQKHKEAVRQVSGCSVILPRTLVARAVQELM
jgi:protein AroM